MPTWSTDNPLVDGTDYPQVAHINELRTTFQNGDWVPCGTWTYASSTTFTVMGDLTPFLSPGDRIKLTQTTVKYFLVTGVSISSGTTTVTISAGSDYTLANAAIISPYFSKAITPNGFPGSFAYTATITGFSANPTVTPRFSLIGKTCTIYFEPTADGTSNATTFTITAPITAASSVSDQYMASRIKDNGTEKIGLVYIASNSTTITAFNTVPGTSWTASGAKNALFNLTYLTNL